MNLKYWKYLAVVGVMAIAVALPTLGYCSVDSSLDAIQDKLTGTILPAVGILGLMFAGLSFFTGNPNARQHLVMGIIGAVVGFGAPSIVDLIRSLVH